jgi:hypothetical protein
MFTPADIPVCNSPLNVQAMLEIAGNARLEPGREDDMAPARELASTLMGGQEVVSVETLNIVQAIQPATLVFREEGAITAVFGQLLLRQSAIVPFFEGRFDALNLDTDYLCRAGEPIGLGYVWGLAASSKRGSTALFQYGAQVRPALFPNLTIVSRAVTPIGRHIALNRYRYQPLRHPDDDLMIRVFANEAVAA